MHSAPFNKSTNKILAATSSAFSTPRSFPGNAAAAEPGMLVS